MNFRIMPRRNPPIDDYCSVVDYVSFSISSASRNERQLSISINTAVQWRIHLTCDPGAGSLKCTDLIQSAYAMKDFMVCRLSCTLPTEIVSELFIILMQ